MLPQTLVLIANNSYLINREKLIVPPHRSTISNQHAVGCISRRELGRIGHNQTQRPTKFDIRYSGSTSKEFQPLAFTLETERKLESTIDGTGWLFPSR